MPEHSDYQEGCARRGGVCDCGEAPCAVAFREQWFAEMREHGIPDDKARDIWEAGRRIGRRAAQEARGSR